jgi:hypothetical protein
MTEQTGPHFLLVGDSRDIGSIEGMLGRLPTAAYGQVYLEVSSGVQIKDLAAPVGMAITWLCRDRVRPAGEGFAPWQDDLGRPGVGWAESGSAGVGWAEWDSTGGGWAESGSTGGGWAESGSTGSRSAEAGRADAGWAEAARAGASAPQGGAGLVPRGVLAARATAGWISEWMPEERVDQGEPCVLWIGCSSSNAMDSLYERLSTTLGEAHLHHPHHPQ